MRRKIWRMAGVGLVIWLLLYFLPAPVTPVSGDITYFASWDESGIEPLADGGWRVTNDLGYEVQVYEGYVVSYRVTSMECPHSHSLFQWLLEQLLPSPVKAGHGSEADPALLAVPFVESLTAPQSREWGTVTVPEPLYCQGHYLVARADQFTEGVNETNTGTTLFIRGMAAGKPFTIESGLAWGQFSDFRKDDQPVHVQIGAETVEIEVIRQLSSLFDGIDFETVSAEDRARTVLRNLTNNTRFIVRQGKTHGTS